MKLTGLDVFDSTIEHTTEWLQDLMHELNWTDRRKSFNALRLVLQGLRDHLPLQHVVRLGNQLPMLVRGFYFEDWDPAGKPLQWESRDEMLAGIGAYFRQDGDTSDSAEAIVRAVFRVLDKKATEGTIDDLHPLLPAHLLELWPLRLRAA